MKNPPLCVMRNMSLFMRRQNKAWDDLEEENMRHLCRNADCLSGGIHVGNELVLPSSHSSHSVPLSMSNELSQEHSCKYSTKANSMLLWQGSIYYQSPPHPNPPTPLHSNNFTSSKTHAELTLADCWSAPTPLHRILIKETTAVSQRPRPALCWHNDKESARNGDSKHLSASVYKQRSGLNRYWTGFGLVIFIWQAPCPE